ncbi:hypothetical protein V6N13_123573 [Hibiscus sabdariffa]
MLDGSSGVGEGVGGGGTSPRRTMDDAVKFLTEVKETFRDQEEKYNMFLEVMKDFRAQRLNTMGVIVRVKGLFKGHDNLINGFNTFLPKGYEISLDDEHEAFPMETDKFEETISIITDNIKLFRLL